MLRTLAARVQRWLTLLRREGVREAARRAGSALRRRVSGPAPAYELRQWLEYYAGRGELTPRQAPDAYAGREVDFSIVVVTWNNLLLNQICLHSIFANTSGLRFEVVVVDNGSTDGTPAWLREFAGAHPNVQLVLNAENRGFAAANNQGARLARSLHLVFLNNDTVVTPGWLERLAAHLRDKSVGLVGPVTNATGNEARIPTEYRTPAVMEALAADRAATKSGKAFDIRMLALYCVVARKADFDALGGLDERFGMGMFEDEDLALRYQQAGLRVVCAQDVFIHHFWRQSFGKLELSRYDNLFMENRRKFEEKWKTEWTPYRS